MKDRYHRRIITFAILVGLLLLAGPLLIHPPAPPPTPPFVAAKIPKPPPLPQVKVVTLPERLAPTPKSQLTLRK